MFKSAIDSKFYANDDGYQNAGSKVNVLAFFKGPLIKIVGFSANNRHYRILNQEMEFIREIGSNTWKCYAVTALERASRIASVFTLLFNPERHEWRLAEE